MSNDNQVNNEDKLLSSPPKFVTYLIYFNLIFWIILVPGYSTIVSQRTELLPLVLGCGLFIPVYVILLRIGRVLTYIYYRFYWWLIALQFTCLSLVTIGLIVAMMAGAISLDQITNSRFQFPSP